MDKLQHNLAALKRWRTRLKRAMTAVDKLEKQRRRLEAKPVKLTENIGSTTWSKPSTTVADIDPPVEVLAAIKEVAVHDVDAGIPDFLKRGVAAQKAVDEVIADQIRDEQEATKKKKAQGRIAKMKAKQSGDTKRMPLSGKDALRAIFGD
jgi:hypothetical protein